MLNGPRGAGDPSAAEHVLRRLTRVPAAVRGWLAPRRRTRPVPPGLDVDLFLRLARASFLRLQAAWDAGDLAALERLTTGPLLQELRDQLSARDGDEGHRTEVLDLQARLLAFEELRDAFVASVEFSGLIREHADAGVTEFRELWLLAKLKPHREDTWQLARVQALA